MKFKATSSFRNTNKFKVEGRKAGDAHIEKGDVFDADIDHPATANVIAILAHCGRIIDVENQPENGKKIDAEVEAEKKKEAEAETKAHAGKK